MNIEEVRAYCLSLPAATEDFPFDDVTLVFRVCGKIFGIMPLDTPEWLVLKCNADYATELREQYEAITPAFHMNKKYWNQINLYSSLSRELIYCLIRHSYSEVVKKLPKKIQAELSEQGL